MSADIFLTYEILIFVFILLSAFFSGSEIAVVSSSRITLEADLKKGSRRAARAIHILDNIEDAIGMILIGNNIANIAATSFITFIAAKAYMLDDKELFYITVVQTVIFLVFCEISPKIAAKAKAESFLKYYSLPIIILMKVFMPLTRISLFFSGLIKGLSGTEERMRSVISSRDEIGLLFELGEKEGIIYEGHEDLVREVLSIKDIMAFQVMTPTIDIISIEAGQSIKDLLNIIYKTKFSRIPVYSERVDNIIGYIFYRDIIKNKNVKTLSEITNKAHYIPATKNIIELYQEMYENGIPIVFVVDEYGGVIGMVSNEDIAEEIVGEIQTSDHSEEELIKKINERKYILSGDLDIEFLQKKFPIKIEKERFETLAGFITFHLKKIPKKGDRLVYKKFTFIVEEATERSVEKVIMMMPGKRTKP